MNASTVSRDQRLYANIGNPPLMELLEGDVQQVLDIGCGAGDNAVLF